MSDDIEELKDPDEIAEWALKLANETGRRLYRRQCAKDGKELTREGELLYKQGMVAGIQIVGKICLEIEEEESSNSDRHNNKTTH